MLTYDAVLLIYPVVYSQGPRSQQKAQTEQLIRTKLPDMDLSVASVAALLLLFAAASCAPHGHAQPDACADVRSSSLELNHVARTVSKEARNGSKDVSDFTPELIWMEAKDKCDPENLKQKPATCLGKILSVLTSYLSAVETVAGFQSCSEFVSKVKPKMQKLHKDMKKCVKTKPGMNHIMESPTRKEETRHTSHWEEDLLCHHTLDRLFSFSILSARVFAVGDPAHHTEGSAQKCM
ncbi:hypothetical protein EYF80_059385 [Liparis tanakae]|uniref:Uncharacterized protein n=1 Tax=Liparis tanakae TaxID=230148 RepID=A0A4Z2ENU0_9TELE|nr:hypothetical protein EYF80_059385 [Liparis tanakae]